MKNFRSARCWSVIFFATWNVLVSPEHAQASPATLMYQGRILGAGAQPLEHASVSFDFSILSPDGTCVLYREQVNAIDMRNSKGVFEVAIGTGAKSYPASPTFSLLDSFNNFNGALTCNGGVTYSPLASDGRVLRVQFFDGTGWRIVTPDSIIRSVPYAGFAASAQKLGNKTAADFVSRPATCSAGEVITFDGTNFTCAAGGGGGGGSGTVTSVATGTGLTGGPITGTGTVSLAPIADKNILANISGASAAPASITLSALVDSAISSTQGSILYRNNSTWVALPPGTNGHFLQTQGAAANPQWAASPGASGSVGGDLSGTLPNPTVVRMQGRAIDATAPADGQVLLWDNGNNTWKAQHVRMQDVRNSWGGTQMIPSSTCTASQAMVWSVITDRFTCQTVDDTSKLPLAGGTMTGDLNMGTRKITNVSNVPWTAANPAGGQDGQSLRWNNTSGQWEWFTAGAAGAGITTVNGASGSAQTLAPTASATSYGFTTATNTHTFSIPSASGAGVTAGTISKTEYDAFNAKQAAGNYITTLTGDVTSSGFSAGSVTTTLANSGVTAGTYTKVTVDAKGRVTVGDTLVAADIPSLDAAKITIGVLAPARLGTGTADNTTYLRGDGTWQPASVTETDPKVGSNATDYLSKWNGTALVNSGVFENSGNVGIGTANPGSTLDVQTTSGLTVKNPNLGQDGGGLINLSGRFNGTATSFTRFAAITGAKENGTSGNDAGYFAAYTAPNGGAMTERLRISSTGNVGVGTATPSGKFSVGSSGGQNAYFFYDNDDVGDSTDGQSFYIYRRAAEGDNSLRIFHDQWRQTRIESTGPLFFDSAEDWSSTRMQGRAPSPYSPSSSGSYSPTAWGLLLTNTWQGNQSATSIELASKNGAGTDQRSFITTVSQNTGYAPAMTFALQTGATAYNEVMRIAPDGSVGIGTTNPGAKLEVGGQVKITGGSPGAGKVLTSDADGLASWQTVSAGGSGTVTSVAAGTGLTGGTITTTGTLAVNVGTGASQIPQLDSSGKLVNDVIPTLGGDVSGTLDNMTVAKIQGRAMASTAPTDGQVVLWDNGSTTWRPQHVRMQDIRNAWGGTQMIPSTLCSANQAMVWSVVTDRFTCQNIDSLNASAITAGTIDVARLGTGTADNTKYLRGDGTWQTVSATESDPQVGVNTANYLSKWDGTALVASGIFENGGNVGVGTNTPAGIFEVRAPAATGSTTGGDIVFRAQQGGSSGATGGNIDLYPGSGGGGWNPGRVNIQVGQSGEPALDIGRDGSDGYVSTSASAVGPAFTMVLANSWSVTGNTAIQGYEVMNSAADVQKAYIGSVSTASGNTPAIVFGQQTGGSAYAERMRINPNGNVGIGTDNPAAKLHVNGDIKMGNSSATCDSTTEGSQRYNSTTKGMEFCDGSVWISMNNNLGLKGMLNMAGAANCDWSVNGAAFTSYTTADSACSTATVTGQATLPTEGKIPAIRMSTLGAGTYRVIFNLQIYPSSASTYCHFRISDGTNAGNAFINFGTTDQYIAPGIFTYASTQTNVTFYLQAKRTSGSGNCSVYADNDPSSLVITVEKISN